MTNINPYLTFNGNCREAMTFYNECIGGELTIQTVGESPMADKVPPQMKDQVMHSSLVKDGILLMASDMMTQGEYKVGNSISLCINCADQDEARGYFSKLSKGGKVGHPLEVQFWGALFGDLTDKFGHQWLINCEIAQHAGKQSEKAAVV